MIKNLHISRFSRRRGVLCMYWIKNLHECVHFSKEIDKMGSMGSDHFFFHTSHPHI